MTEISNNSNSKAENKRVLLVFLSSLLVVLLVLFAGSEIKENILMETMEGFARASSRETDGAVNLVVMNGDSGYIDRSDVYLKYLSNGFISIIGINDNENSYWKRISEFELDQGRYTLTGLSGNKEKTVELQLTVIDVVGNKKYYRQFDTAITVETDNRCNVILYVHVYPYTEINAIARPAIYEEAD